MMVLMTHNTDISDAWEREAADPDSADLRYDVGLRLAMRLRCS